MVLQLPTLFYGEHREVRTRARSLLKSVWKSGGWSKADPPLEPVAPGVPILLPNASVYARMPPKGTFWRMYCVGQTVEETWLTAASSADAQSAYVGGLRNDWFVVGMLGCCVVPYRLEQRCYLQFANTFLQVIQRYAEYVPSFTTTMDAFGRDFRDVVPGSHNTWFWSLRLMLAELGHSIPPPPQNLPQTADALFEFLRQSGCIRPTSDGFEAAI